MRIKEKANDGKRKANRKTDTVKSTGTFREKAKGQWLQEIVEKSRSLCWAWKI